MAARKSKTKPSMKSRGAVVGAFMLSGEPER